MEDISGLRRVKFKDSVNHLDYQTLAQKVFLQAIADYITLHKKSARQKPHLAEAFVTSSDLLFDSEYTVGPFLDDNNEPIKSYDFMCLASERERVDLEQVHATLKEKLLNHWKPLMNLNTIEVPEIITISGVPWDVIHKPSLGLEPEIFFEERVILLNKTSPQKSYILLYAVVSILFDECGIRATQKARNQFIDQIASFIFFSQ